MVVQPWDRVLVPTQRNMHSNVFEFFYRTGAPTQVEDGNFRLNTRFLEHSSVASPSIKGKKSHKPCSPHPRCCLLFLGTSDDHPVRSPVWPLSISSLRGAKSFKLNCCYYKGKCQFQAKKKKKKNLFLMIHIWLLDKSPVLGPGRRSPSRNTIIFTAIGERLFWYFPRYAKFFVCLFIYATLIASLF